MLDFLAIGDWGPDQLRVAWGRGSRPAIAEVEEYIEQAWAEVLRRPGVHLFDGPMCRLESWKASPQYLNLIFSQTSYKQFLGTNLTHPELADRYGREALANPIGVSAALVTDDGFLLMGRRNASVAYYPHRVHPFAGALEPKDKDDVFAALRRELAEELHFGRDDIADIRCCGMVEDRSLRQPELIFRVRSTRTRVYIEARMDRDEHRESHSFPATRQAIESALNDPALTPVAIASLLLHGRAEFGEEWFEKRKSEN